MYAEDQNVRFFSIYQLIYEPMTLSRHLIFSEIGQTPVKGTTALIFPVLPLHTSDRNLHLSTFFTLVPICGTFIQVTLMNRKRQILRLFTRTGRSYLSQEAVHKHLLVLTKAVHPVNALYVVRGIPRGVEDDDPAGGNEVYAERAGSR